LLSGAVLTAPCSGEAVGDAGELLAEEDGLADDAVDFGAAFVLAAAFGLLLVQLPWVSEPVVALAEEAGAVAFGLLLVLALPLLLALLLVLALPLGLADALLLPAAGLDGGLDAVGDGVTEAGAEALGELAELADAVAVDGGDADDCGHDEIGVGAWCFAAVVRAAATPPLPSACPAPPAAGAPAELADGRLLSTLDTDEATAWRSGGTEASTMPATNTAQATAMAGLSTAIRQSRGGRCPWPRPLPEEPLPRAAYQRRTVSARKPELAGAADPACLLA
jgi:hypothetical protein